ncbi:hypothetical protein SAMN03159341_11858 [Paenibacillus sp. 1_12]|nr:hypothetical protein [Paenibacillus sp. 1_12]SFM15106.1 hypothetical protein SAMN03159341_11858 [Paenibacillus sp. 1_12]
MGIDCNDMYLYNVDTIHKEIVYKIYFRLSTHGNSFQVKERERDYA